MTAPRGPLPGGQQASRSSRRRKALFLGLLIVFFVVFVIVYLLVSSGNGGGRPDEPDAALAPGQVYFLELAYEHDFAPVAGDELPSRARDKSLDGYVFRQEGATLYPCSPGVEQKSVCQLMIGKRLHFPHNQDLNTAQDLGYAEGGYESWAVDKLPTPDDILMYGPTCWLRLPVRASAAMKGARCEVTVGQTSVSLAPGEHKEVWSAQRTYTVGEYAKAIEACVNATRQEPITIPADTLKARLPVDDAGKLTLYARLVAVYHGPVNRSPLHLLKERSAGIQALETGDYEGALSHFDPYLEVIPDDEVVRGLRARAATGKEQNIGVHRLHGTVAMPDGAAPTNPKSWVGIRRPEDPADHSRDLSGVKEGKFAFHVEAGTYILTVYIPKFRPVSRTVQVQDDTGLEIQLTEEDRSQ